MKPLRDDECRMIAHANQYGCVDGQQLDKWSISPKRARLIAKRHSIKVIDNRNTQQVEPTATTLHLTAESLDIRYRGDMDIVPDPEENDTTQEEINAFLQEQQREPSSD